MKRFIFIIVVLIGFIAMPAPAKAQYVSLPTAALDSVKVQNLNKIASDAMAQVNRGKSEFFIGLFTTSLGAAIAYVIPAIHYSNTLNAYSYGVTFDGPSGKNVSNKPDAISQIAPAGYIVMAFGTIFEIMGAYRWWNGAVDLKGARVAATANGFVINF